MMNMELSQEWQTFLKEQFPEGSRIRLREAADENCPVEPGSVGVLTEIDSSGQFHVEWENGQTSLLTAADQFRVLSPEPVTLKFYMPLNAEIFEPDEYGDISDEPSYLDGSSLVQYEEQIVAKMYDERMPEETERGLMHWYHEADGVNEKVQSVFFNAEYRNGQLWGVAECRVTGQLSPAEKEQLCDFITGQASDGWGEGFEQREIRTEDGELYVQLWSSGSDWSLKTEEERFGTKAGKASPQKVEAAKKYRGPSR